MKKAAFFVSLLGLIFSTSFAYASSGTEGASFLDIPVGAGPAAMGSAYAAAATDAYAPIYNPAGLAFLNHPQFAGQHLEYLESIRDEFGSFVMPLRRDASTTQPASLGVAIQYLGSGDINGTGTSGEPIGDFSVHYAAYSFAYGRKVTDQLALGLTGKLIEAKIADTSAKAYAADLGVLYAVSDKMTVSATANNVGSKLKFTNDGDSLPTAFHLGAAFDLKRYLKSTVEGVYSKTGLFSARTGLEWSPMDLVSLRTGYKTDTTKGLSVLAGLTVGMGLHVFGQEFAYAWLPYGDLGDTQYFSMLLKFGKEDSTHNLLKHEALKWNTPKTWNEEKSNDPEYQQLMQLLNDEPAPERNALAPIVGADQ